MSYTFTLTGRKSELTANIYPPIQLDDGEYVIGLINFESYNVIPNIEENVNNCFYFGKDKITIPTGSYDIRDIHKYLQNSIKEKSKKDQLIIKENRNTFKCEILTSKHIDFTKADTLRELLGFRSRLLDPSSIHVSDYPVDILKVNAICVVCNLTAGSYNNNNATHIVHEFFPNCEPGEKIIESPQNAIYLPLNVKTISEIRVQIQDQNGDLINFREEVITLRLHLKKLP